LSSRRLWIALLLASCFACQSAPPVEDESRRDAASRDDRSGGRGGGGGSGGARDAASAPTTADPDRADGSAGSAGLRDAEAPHDARAANDAGAPAGPSTPSTLPLPPGPAEVPRPSASATMPGLKVLPWAGFKAAISYTFDDAQPTHVTHWPTLKATGVPLTFYVTSANVAPSSIAVWKDIASSGSELGNHTVHHCHGDLAGCTPGATLESELDGCTSFLRDTIGVARVSTAAYPFGDVAYRAASRSRFFLARGVNGGMVAPSDDTDPWQVPTIPAVGGESASVFSGWIDKARDQGRWGNFLFHSILPGPNWYAGVDVGAIVDSIAHAKAARDVWLGTMSDVGAYWVGAKLIASAASQTSGDAIVWSWKRPAGFPSGRFARVTILGGTLTQGGRALSWNPRGFYEVALDPDTLTWRP
jgi:peptidoglycan/xylan/chitin deacetylase (PgdA/CDA1 family)